jgi:hypothetical protein
MAKMQGFWGIAKKEMKRSQGVRGVKIDEQTGRGKNKVSKRRSVRMVAHTARKNRKARKGS